MGLGLYPRAKNEALSAAQANLVQGADPGWIQSFLDAGRELKYTASSDSELSNQIDYVDSLIDKVRGATGESLQNPLTVFAIESKNPNAPNKKQIEYARFQKRIKEISLQRPDLNLPEISQESIVAGGEEFGRRRVQAGKEAAQNRISTGSQVAAFAGQAAYAMRDPINMGVNLLTLPLAPARGALKAIGMDFGIGTLSQAAVTGANYDYRRRIDPEFTLSSAIDEVAAAGFGSAVLGGIFRGGGAVIRRLTGGRGLPAQPRRESAAPPGLQGVPTRRQKDVTGIVSRETQTVRNTNPAPVRTPQSEALHKQALQQAQEQFDLGETIQVPAPTAANANPRPGKVIAANGQEIAVNYEVVDASQLITSHNDELNPDPRFPAELQPRDRTRAASQEQINKIASNLKPELLGPSVRADSGAPIVGMDGVVESGNGRVLALRRAYARGGTQQAAYRKFLQDQGFDITGMERPVLVARRASDLVPQERQMFVRAANTATAARMSASEQALSDARMIDSQLIQTMDQHGVYSAATAKAIFAKLPPEERAALIDADGNLSMEGRRRLQGALLGRAYGDASILGRMLEDTDNNIKSLGNALADAAPQWAALRDGISSGTVDPRMELTKDLLDAVKLVMRARDEGVPIKDLMNQTDMFGNGPSENAKLFARNFFAGDEMKRAVSQKKVADFLKEFATEAAKNESGPRLLGDDLTPEQIMETALRKVDRQDLLPFLENAVSQEALKKLEENPDLLDDQVIMEAMRMLGGEATGTGPEVKIPVGLDDKGNPIMGSLADEYEKIDKEIEAATQIDACVTGKPLSETAQ